MEVYGFLLEYSWRALVISYAKLSIDYSTSYEEELSIVIMIKGYAKPLV
jgi:hypothetical protein